MGMFYEQSAANLLLHMPRADFSLVHTAATERFGLYADPIMAVINADTGEAVQDANLALHYPRRTPQGGARSFRSVYCRFDDQLGSCRFRCASEECGRERPGNVLRR